MTTKELEVLKGIYRASSSLSEIEIEALRSAIEMIEKLMVTEDGIIAQPNMEVFFVNSFGYIESSPIRPLSAGVGGVSKYYSTHSAALAAAKKEG